MRKILNILRGAISLAMVCCIIFSSIVPTYAMENEKTKGRSEASAIMDVLINSNDSLSLPLTGKWSDDVVSVANNQKKYWEEKQGTEEEGKSIKKIWQEKKCINWNIDFIKLCFRNAKVSDKFVPYDFEYDNCIEILESERYHLFREKEEYIPQRGDLVVLDLDGDKKTDCLGLLEDVSEESATVIEGNTEEYVCISNYMLNDKRVLGYGSINEACKYQYSENIESKSNNKQLLMETESEFGQKITRTANNSTIGAANSTLKNNETYIIYAQGTDNQYYALTEFGQTEIVTLAGNEIIVSDSSKAQWTYNAEEGTFQNSQGQYLNITEMYSPPIAGENPQKFDMQKSQEGYIVRTSMSEEMGSYPLYLYLLDDKFVMNGYEVTEIFFARVDNEESSTEPPVSPVLPDSDLGIRKYVEKLDKDDYYDLNLTVNGAYSEGKRNKADIIYIVDTTGSMKYAMNGDENNSYERWNAIVDSMEYMMNVFESARADVMHSMIFFSGTQPGEFKDAKVGHTWTNKGDDILNALKNERNYLGGGTNYEAAYRELVYGEKEQLLKTMRSDAEHVVVFLSDGEPNTYYDYYGRSTHDPSYDAHEAIGRAKSMLNVLNTGNYGHVHKFYSVGVGSEMSEEATLKDLTAGLKEKSIETGYAHCTNRDEIKKFFGEIIHSIINIKYDHVKMVDKLSGYAELVEGTKIRIVVTAKNGKVWKAKGNIKDGATLTLDPTNVNRERAELKLTYDKERKKLELKFPEKYILEDGWEYKIIATIKPTKEAYEAYKENAKYPHIGDKDTGETSTKKEGFYSNTENEAKLESQLNGNKIPDMIYPKPVIQVSGQKMEKLPETGGQGTAWNYRIGVLLLSFAIAMMYSKRKEVE